MTGVQTCALPIYNILNVPSRTQEKKEKKLGIAKDIDKDDMIESGNIKIYLSRKARQERVEDENDGKDDPEINARHKILCKYGKGTDWCTASATGTYHRMYAHRNIYIVHINDKPEYQFMDCSKEDTDDGCQFHDSKNEEVETIPVELAELIRDKLPKIADFYNVVSKTLIKNLLNNTENLDYYKILKYLNKNQLDANDVSNLFQYAKNKDQLSNILITHKKRSEEHTSEL